MQNSYEVATHTFSGREWVRTETVALTISLSLSLSLSFSLSLPGTTLSCCLKPRSGSRVENILVPSTPTSSSPAPTAPIRTSYRTAGRRRSILPWSLFRLAPHRLWTWWQRDWPKWADSSRYIHVHVLHVACTCMYTCVNNTFLAKQLDIHVHCMYVYVCTCIHVYTYVYVCVMNGWMDGWTNG